MNYILKLVRLCFVIILVALAGCESPKTNFFILDAAPVSNNKRVKSCHKTIALEKVVIAKYLDKPNIITRIKPNEILMAEFDQWAEPLDDNILMVLQQNLSAQLKTDSLITYPWIGKSAIDYRVQVKVKQFDVDSAGQSILKASWYVYNNEKKLIASRNSTYHAQTSKPEDYLSIAYTMNRNVNELSNDIARQLNKYC